MKDFKGEKKLQIFGKIVKKREIFYWIFNLFCRNFAVTTQFFQNLNISKNIGNINVIEKIGEGGGGASILWPPHMSLHSK